MTHPHTVVRWIGEEVGHGLFARADIPRGTITWVRDPLDRIYSEEELAALDERTRETVVHFSYRDGQGSYVFCWDNTRFVNHSFAPNCLLTPCGFEIAVEDIPAGAELTMDYGCLNILEPFEPEGEPRDGRSIVLPHDLGTEAARWDQMIGDALRLFPAVGQPLEPWLPESTKSLIRSAALGREAFPSVATMRFRG